MDYEDMLWAFFQNCWHLKDWILNDATAPPTLKDGIEDKVTDYEPLQFCADLANRSKHLTLRPWAIRRDANLRADIEFHGDARPMDFRYYVVDEGGKTYEAVDLAHKAIAAWEKIIEDAGSGTTT
jgi:hypothetical protein